MYMWFSVSITYYILYILIYIHRYVYNYKDNIYIIYIYIIHIYTYIYIHKYDMRILKQTMNVVHSRNYEKNPTRPKVFPP